MTVHRPCNGQWESNEVGDWISSGHDHARPAAIILEYAVFRHRAGEPEQRHQDFHRHSSGPGWTGNSCMLVSLLGF